MLNLYIGKLKPLLTQDKWMPAAVRRAIHEAADELWADVMLELPRSLDKMLESGQLDLVSICTPSGVHARQTIQCAQAGIPVMTEKPMATYT